MRRAEFNAHYNYQPYTGGGGPTVQTQNHNAQVLVNALKDANVQCELVDTPDDWIIDIKAVQLTGFNGNKFLIIFDRWGYCAEDGPIDQLDLYCTVNILIDAFKE